MSIQCIVGCSRVQAGGRPTREQVAEAIELASGYIERATGPDGRFVYVADLRPDAELDPDEYNTIRHAGTIYALAQAEARQPSERRRDAILRSVRHFRQTMAPPPGAVLPLGEPMIAVWSQPEVHNGREIAQAQLGGVGLGLVGLVSVEGLMPGTTPREDLRAMGRFTRYLQRNSGEFWSQFVPARGGRDDSFKSLYYPGEAALGLTMLYELDRDPQWLAAAGKALVFLARERESQPLTEIPHDHWALIATSKVLPHIEAFATPEARGLIMGHAVQVIEAMLAGVPRDVDDPDLRGMLTFDGTLTPTATRLEGLLAMLPLLDGAEHAELRARVVAACHGGIAFLLAAQIREGELAGGIPRARKPLPEQMTKGAIARVGEVRIDYVQHALSAFIEYERQLLAGP